MASVHVLKNFLFLDMFTFLSPAQKMFHTGGIFLPTGANCFLTRTDPFQTHILTVAILVAQEFLRLAVSQSDNSDFTRPFFYKILPIWNR